MSLATLSALAWAAPAAAADLQVRVLTASGRPAADVVVTLTPTAAWSPRATAAPVLVVQKDIRFEPYVTAVPIGSTLRFVNRDGYDHHVRSLPGGPLGTVAPASQFEFRLAALKRGVESQADVRMDLAGTVVLGCHLHGSMRGHLFVSPSPWVGVTDDYGRVQLPDVPPGQAELRLWHPDQLVAQTAQRLDVGAGSASAASAEAALNFTPRRRPPPRAPSEYGN